MLLLGVNHSGLSEGPARQGFQLPIAAPVGFRRANRGTRRQRRTGCTAGVNAAQRSPTGGPVIVERW